MSGRHQDLRAAVIDGRAQTPRFKQRQLFELHEKLKSSRASIISAIRDEGVDAQTEAEVQYCQTIEAVAGFYHSINIAKELSDEYRIARGEDHASRRVPFGYAYIVPTKFHLLYSTVVPIAAAIRAGNCVCLQLQQTYSQLSTLLRKVLSEALDSDTFLILNDDPFEDQFRDVHGVYLSGNPELEVKPAPRHLNAISTRAVTIVARDANLDTAATDIVRARFSFGGKSPYAPDAVLVDEFALPKLVEKLTQKLAARASSQLSKRQNGIKLGQPKDNLKSTLRKIKDDEDVEILAKTSCGAVALIRSRESGHLQGKIEEPILILHPITSTDDAIDYVNDSAGQAPKMLMAAYFFGEAATTKYLAQFTRSRLSCSNAIPLALLVGGPAPIDTCPAVHPRYSPEMFTYAKPDFVSFSGSSKPVGTLLRGQDQVTSTDKLVSQDSVLKPMDEPVSNALGFFEQGIFIGLGVVLSSLATCAFISTKYLAPMVVSRLSRSIS